MVTCTKCNGVGKLSWTTRDESVCYRCKGTGKVKDRTKENEKRKAKKEVLLAAMIEKARVQMETDQELKIRLGLPCWCNCGKTRKDHIAPNGNLFPAFAANILNGKE